MNQSQADSLAAKALQYIAQDPDFLLQFIVATGLNPTSLRAESLDGSFWAAVLSFLRQHEAECTAFASNLSVSAKDLEMAIHLLEENNQKLAD